MYVLGGFMLKMHFFNRSIAEYFSIKNVEMFVDQQSATIKSTLCYSTMLQYDRKNLGVFAWEIKHIFASKQLYILLQKYLFYITTNS